MAMYAIVTKSHYIFSVRSAIAETEHETSEDFLSLRVKTEEEKVALIHLFMQDIIVQVTNLIGERGS